MYNLPRKETLRITILTYGSRGDVQPYLALGLSLAQVGHQVRLAAPGVYRAFVERYASHHCPDRLTFAPLPGDPAGLMQAAGSGGWLPFPVRMAAIVARHLAPLSAGLIEQSAAACRDADLIIHTLVTTVIGNQLARQRGVPDLSALVFPIFSPTREFPNPLFPPWPDGPGLLARRLSGFSSRYNYLTHREFNRVFWHAARLGIGRLNRSGAGLETPTHWLFPWPDGILPETNPARPTPVLYGISPHMLPRPVDWEPHARLSGPWFLDQPPGWQPDPALERFLDGSPPAVGIGFGSLIPQNARRLARITLQALEATGQRGVLIGGWGGLAAHLPAGAYSPDRLFVVDEVPFDWLFPRLAAVVHHGGIGTSAAALRAGLPSVIIPFSFDQPFWARQLHALGAAPPPIASNRLTAQRLAAALHKALEDESIRTRAGQIGTRLRQEDGLAQAVELIENLPPFVPG
jgi:sterol 3beta-glucosyltransferase